MTKSIRLNLPHKVSLNIKKVILWWFLILPVLLTSSFVHSIESAQLSTLPNVEEITQDNNGFIWLIGQQGLTRFDGKDLLSFANHNSEWPLPFTWTHNAERHGDRLLISTESKGVWWFEPNTGITTPLNLTLTDNSVYRSTYFNGKYYVFSDHIYLFDEETQHTTPHISGIDLLKFIKTKDALYFYNKNSLNLITDDGYSPILEVPITTVASLGDTLIVVKGKTLLAYHNNILIKEKKLNYRIKGITKAHNSNNFFIIDEHGNIHKFSQELVPLKHSFPKVESLGVSNIFHDSSNVIWYYNGDGVKKLSEQYINNKPFYFNTKVNSIKLESYKNDIVMGSYGDGIHTFDILSTLFPEEIKTQLKDKARVVKDIQKVGDDLYFATFDGLWKYDDKTKTLTKVPFEQNNQILLDINLVNNLLYLATDGNGFIIFDHTTGKVIEVIDNKYNFSSPEILDSTPVNNNQIWLATAANIDVYNKMTRTISSINLQGSSKISSLINTHNKVFAFSKGNGVFVLSYSGEIINQFATGVDFGKAKLIGDEIWAPSKRGVFRINPDTLEIILVPNTEKYSFTSEPVIFNNLLHIAHYGGVVTLPFKKTTKYDPDIFISKTTVSGESLLLNKEININSSNDVLQLDLASLDYRSGQSKQFKYQINNGVWHPINGNQLTLTGLASGSYYITIMGTNSLGQWSNKKAFTQVHVAYPWYWTPKLRVLYTICLVGLLIIGAWLLYLRGRSISHIHALLNDDIKVRGKTALNVSRNLSHVLSLYQTIPTNDQPEVNETHQQIKSLLQESVKELTEQSQTKVPDNLYGNSLTIALPYLADFVHKKYHINIEYIHELNDEELSYELQSDIYTMIYEAIISAVLNGNGRNFTISLQEFKQKIWLTITDDGDSFTHFKSKINFDMAMYYIRQIANKYAASVNTFEEQNQGSQLVISIPLMQIS